MCKKKGIETSDRIDVKPQVLKNDFNLLAKLTDWLHRLDLSLMVIMLKQLTRAGGE